MAFEKTIAELNRIRNMEYERLRYDRRIWQETAGEMMADIRMIEFAKNDVRSPEELNILEQDQRMMKFYKNKFYSNTIHATKEEVADLVNYYNEEMPEHRDNVKDAIQKYNAEVVAFQTEVQTIFNKYKPILKENLKELANLQQDENYVFNSKGIPNEWIVMGIGKYKEYYTDDIDNYGPLSSDNVKNYISLYKNEKLLIETMLEKTKEVN